jgi:two-component system response regulator GlrR
LLAGRSAAIAALIQQIDVAARDRYPVWIYGEEGVDRDCVARRVHERSPWATGRFDTLEASALPAELVRREIYGAEAGAILQLPSPHDGALQRAGQGTLLLEGVERLSKELQEELSTSLSSGRFRKVGGSTELPVECRVIVAGPQPLAELVRSGRLVRSLADRLSTLEIRIPPLRQRREDIPLLAAHAFEEAKLERESETGRPCSVRGFSEAAQARLTVYDWPGNDRELHAQVRAALALTAGEEIEPQDLMLGWSSEDGIPSFREAKRAFEREYVMRLLRICQGNISRAARLARKDRKDFYDVMRRNTINPVEFRR